MRIVIDFGAIWHAIRRWAWQEFGPLHSEDGQCMDCGRELTRDEEIHYICTCERREAIASERIGA